MVLLARIARALLLRPRLALLGFALAVATGVWLRGPWAPPAAPVRAAEPAATHARPGVAEDIEPLKPINARAILGRAWFDRYPKSAKDEVKLWIFLGGGIGIYENGSAWKIAYEIFDFERQGDSVALEFLQDGKKATTRFSIATCDDVPPFDVCLTLVDPPRGPAKYYGFASDDEMNAHIPWARAMIDSAKANAGARD